MIVYFDIDGTLITEDDRQFLPDSTVRAVKKLRQNGHYAFINSGRTIFNIIHQPYIQAIGFDGYVCACGSYILYEGRELYNHLVPDELHDVILQTARNCHMELMLEGPECF